jgi:murein tripeptide amidase MpaA
MINADGVIYGNFRCNLAGCDLNRQWNEPNKVLLFNKKKDFAPACLCSQSFSRRTSKK